MEFEVLKVSHVKRNIIISLMIVAIISTIVINFTKAKYRSVASVPIINSTINYSLSDLTIDSIYQKENNEYIEVENVPNGGYELNKEKSYCVVRGEAAPEIELNYEIITKSLSVIGIDKRGTRCYLYFDSAFEGQGTETETYLIQNIEDLVALSNAVNSGLTYEGDYFQLEKDLDFQKDEDYEDSTRTDYGDINRNGIIEELKTELTTGEGFVPIGNSTSENENVYFSGNFNGNNYKINNLYINNTQEYEYQGLFGLISNGTVSNLGIGGTIHTKVTSDIGSIAGRINSVTINNCYSDSIITSATEAYSGGGLVGWSRGTSTIENSHNIGDITNSNNTGGLVGGNNGTLTINNSYNTGTVTNNLGHNAGGLIGRDNNDTSKTVIKNSYNRGEVISTNQAINGINSVGGIIGRVYGELEINNVFNESKVSSSVITSTDIQISVGGIIGYSYAGNIIISKSLNSGEITGGLRTGGIIGMISEGNIIINETINKENISTLTDDLSGVYTVSAGGIIGYNNKSKSIILNSYNSGNIESIRRCAGIIGYTNFGASTMIINSYNIGDVTSLNEFITSGITTVYNADNLSNYLYLNNVYNIGTITSSSSVYGISYIDDINTYNVSNTYFLNTIAGSNNTSLNLTAMSASEMSSNTFVNTLNSNLANINLTDIEESLTDYTLSTWILGEDGYPTLNLTD